MSASSIARAATDPQLMQRVTALAHKEIIYDEALAETTYGKALAQGLQSTQVLMWPVAVDTEAAYESALASGRGAPGHDADIIPDGAITSAIVANWPYADGETPSP